jgi:hypothetical protein
MTMLPRARRNVWTLRAGCRRYAKVSYRESIFVEEIYDAIVRAEYGVYVISATITGFERSGRPIGPHQDRSSSGHSCCNGESENHGVIYPEHAPPTSIHRLVSTASRAAATTISLTRLTEEFARITSSLECIQRPQLSTHYMDSTGFAPCLGLPSPLLPISPSLSLFLSFSANPRSR